MGGGKDMSLDGSKEEALHDEQAGEEEAEEVGEEKSAAGKPIWGQWATVTRVGFVPFNQSKVNQDRAMEVANFNKQKDRAFFGVFDGHGQLGHLVSQYVITNLPKHLLKAKNLDSDPRSALESTFVNCNAELATKSNIDCTFSGTTAVAVYIKGKKIYGCNAGDSRAVLAKEEKNGSYKAIALSVDHKPDREDEMKRILDCKGRVEACKGPRGQDIGPARVWLMNSDAPGLAMSRSFGDLVAASVGVIARPEIIERTLEADDRFIIIGSDGIWEFITSQEAVEMAAKAKTCEAAAKALADEADRRWRKEEEVVDDITVIVIMLSH